jgi:hypothetical protein
MIEDETRADGVRALRNHPRRWAAVAAVMALMSAGLAVGCGSSDSDVGSSADTPTGAALAPSLTPPSTTTAAKPTPAQTFYDAQVKKGTVQLVAGTIGDPRGVLEVKPAGLVNNKTDHYYRPGTVVTLHPRVVGAVRFTGWAGPCDMTSRTCKLTMNGEYRVLAGFLAKKKSTK